MKNKIKNIHKYNIILHYTFLVSLTQDEHIVCILFIVLFFFIENDTIILFTIV